MFFSLCFYVNCLYKCIYIYIDGQDINTLIYIYKVRFVGEEALHKEDITWGKRSLRLK